MFDIPKAVQAIFDAIKQIFSYAETSRKQQSETVVIKDKKKSDKKRDLQEDLLLDMAALLTKYSSVFSRGDRIKVKVYTGRIKRLN